MNNIKQVIIVRTDLNMRKGKLAAQVAHASMKVFFDRMKITTEEDITVEQRMYECRYDLDCKNPRHFDCSNCDLFELAGKNTQSDFTTEMLQWMEGSFTKIVVGCNSEQELFYLRKQAEDMGIVNAIILDNGNTEFKEICPFCQGSGRVVAVQDLYCDVDLSKDCAECNGTGKINRPTYTCLAIGPDESEKIDKITGVLKLL